MANDQGNGPEQDMELQKLKALAEEVKGWNNCNQAWLDHSEDEPAAVVGYISEDGDTYPVATIDCDQYYEAQDSLKLARFYAAANPETVLRLIAMIEAPNVVIEGPEKALDYLKRNGMEGSPLRAEHNLNSTTKDVA